MTPDELADLSPPKSRRETALFQESKGSGCYTDKKKDSASQFVPADRKQFRLENYYDYPEMVGLSDLEYCRIY